MAVPKKKPSKTIISMQKPSKAAYHMDYMWSSETCMIL
jgi:hypothetical protein